MKTTILIVSGPLRFLWVAFSPKSPVSGEELGPLRAFNKPEAKRRRGDTHPDGHLGRTLAVEPARPRIRDWVGDGRTPNAARSGFGPSIRTTVVTNQPNPFGPSTDFAVVGR
jgi:hypothetical protein